MPSLLSGLEDYHIQHPKCKTGLRALVFFVTVNACFFFVVHHLPTPYLSRPLSAAVTETLTCLLLVILYFL